MNRYSNIQVLKNENPNAGKLGVSYRRLNLYPVIPHKESDIYVITEFGDRFTLLASQFYNDVTLYWIIAIANPDKVDFGSMFCPIGAQLRIPVDVSEIISSYNKLNTL